MPEPRYVLSQRAADAIREIIAPGSGFGSRPRRIIPAADAPTQSPRPFAIRFGTGVAADGVTPSPALFCYIPNWATAQSFSIVRADETPIIPSSQQPIGTAADAWVQISTATASGTYRVFLGFLDARESTTDLHAYRWQLWVQSGTGTPRPSGFTAAETFPFVFIARVRSGAVEQLVDGAVHIARQWVQQFQRTNEFCLYDSSGSVVLNLDTRSMATLSVTQFSFDSSISDQRGNSYEPITVTIDGVSYVVLGRRA